MALSFRVRRWKRKSTPELGSERRGHCRRVLAGASLEQGTDARTRPGSVPERATRSGMRRRRNAYKSVTAPLRFFRRVCVTIPHLGPGHAPGLTYADITRSGIAI